MPFIDAECLDCGAAHVEMVASLSAEPPACEDCGGRQRKLVGSAAVMDKQLSADRAWDSMGPGERRLHIKQREVVETAMSKGEVGKITVGDRTPTVCKPRHGKKVY